MKLESNNPDDDLAIKVAIVGFSYNSPTVEWTKEHWDFVTPRLAREYPDEELSDYGNNGSNIKLFYALCLGFLLGLYQQGMISDGGFKVAEAQISGLVMLHLGKLTEQELPAG